MSTLPIQDLFPSIRQNLSRHNQLILRAPTGAGKSTALPLAMLDWPEIEGKILLLEPRRLAARMIARYLAKCRGEKVGQSVGLRVRGETQVSAATRLEVVTEGVLTRLIQADPELTGVGLILFDEVHERHLATDLALALALEVQGGLRDDLKLMLMSATLQGQPLDRLLPEAPLLESEGRSYPVSIEYAPVPTGQPWLPALVSQVKRQLVSQDGNLLVFLPGMGEIRTAETQLSEHVSLDVDLCPLYGQLTGAEQDRAVAVPEPGRRKVVLATNLAESSLTIDGITVVVDAGYQRRASLNLRTGQTRLELARISQSSADQRAGRAGRLAPGHCVRLWSETQQQSLAEAELPEIQRADLLSLVLELAAWGTTDVNELAWLSPPPEGAVSRARALLQRLELVAEDGRITALGQRVHRLGADPRLGHMLVKAAQWEQEQKEPGVLRLACDLAALLEEGDPLRGRQVGADLARRLDAARSGRYRQLADKWWSQLKGAHAAQPAHHSEAGWLLALAYPDRIAQGRGGSGHRFLLSGGAGATLEESDPLCAEPYLVVASLNERAGQGDARIHLAAALNLDALKAVQPGLFETARHAGLDSASGALKAERQTRIGALVVARERLSDLTEADYRLALLDHVRRKGLDSLPWSERARTLQARVALAQQHLNGVAWPDLADATLIATLEAWLGPYLAGLTKTGQLKQLDLYQILMDQVPWEAQSLLKQELPERLTVPTGSALALHYHEGGVKLAVRVQEIYGQSDTPRLARGALPVTLELLSPAQRPIQITQDLAAFWAGAWTEVKKEMRGRYPKHLWPDDPANTAPTRKTKRHLT
ncbi:ATP-dependent helicase HrpB [Ferrimonas balearica]|uniref:ATP-dependent helicase HrpB n=1 Tax=Ferrimonas balearica TaxID=44012 RepID=UPI001C99DAE4|nr:ATP-dependent helicase HrpB [Ferrimonas balearica]MBY5921553.1 ATP-dependent helicase HrpB [Ferrimonas balearica]MBY5995107.1 ATP-dependent helicase HrpB [Ferrimonas balearica]